MGRADWFGLSLPAPYPDGEVAVLNRPEDMVVAAQGAAAQATRIIDLGPMMKVSLLTPSGDLLTWTCPRHDAPAPGTEIRLLPQRLHLYRDGQLLGTVEIPIHSNGKQEARA